MMRGEMLNRVEVTHEGEQYILLKGDFVTYRHTRTRVKEDAAVLINIPDSKRKIITRSSNVERRI